MEHGYTVVNVRDVNQICLEYGKVYALIEGETRRRKINRARHRQRVLEVRTAARDIWMGPVASLEWMDGFGNPVSYQAQEIR